jgi:putative ABC transport system permease protein
VLRVTIRSLLAHRLRLSFTALAITLGVAFISGAFTFSATLSESLQTLFSQASAGTDVVISHSIPGGGSASAIGAAAQPLPEAVLVRVRAVPGVAAASGQVSGRAELLRRSGAALPAKFNVALSWPVGAPFQAVFTGRSGKPPTGPGQVMIDQASAKAGGYAVGDRIPVSIAGRAQPFTITGITGYAGTDSLAGGSMAIFDLGSAQRLFGKMGELDSIAVHAASGVDPAVLRDRVAAVLPAGVVATTAATAAATAARQLNSQLSVLLDFFLAFAAIALFVSAFVIWNTFAILVGQRTRELALLRALGAGRRQVFGSVLAEALALGLIASGIGLAVGLGVARALALVLSSFGLPLPNSSVAVPPSGLLIALAAGVAVTVAASLVPARRATVVAPVQAMRHPAEPPGQPAPGRRRAMLPTPRLAVGLGLIAVGAAAVAAGAGAVPAGLGAACCFAGVLVLGPLAVRPLAFAIGAPLRRLSGQAGVLAQGNAMRNPRRTSATAAALVIGLAVITGTAVLVSSAKAQVGQQVAAASRTTFYVQAVNSDAGLTPDLAGRLAHTPGVQAVTEVQQADATVGGATHRNVTGVDPAAIGQFAELGVSAGSLASLSGGGILVSSAVASGAGWHVGSPVTVQFGSWGSFRLRVAGIFAHTGPLSGYLMATSTFRADSGIKTDSVDFVRAPVTARAALTAALAAYPGASLQDQAGYVKSRTSMLNSLLNVVIAMLVLTIVIALLGVVNTLALSVAERTREIGLLRAIGMGRGQARAMIAAESVIIAVIGAVGGTLLGVGLGAALASAVGGTGTPITIPGGQLVLYVLLTAAAGVLASVFPARRAARLDVLAAIASE